ncbi:heme biosynthesis HemY N-terminal domain-containing protein [Rhodocyclus gracilis]|uniref:Heme biosynthesis protein HemY n=1 Tax=Rhodocyclus tenuis TaxID=1066 RepID=A0A6L5JVS5_RHOTE|nr:heme biosynthesis HemY N-terminal domain-containing protein [Rhodocyclus gracilis]MQY51477.1 heme biosynthesis protein HemY [Rhodocyclus gracilis]
MRALFWLLALFALAVGASVAAHFNDGYVLLVFPPYRAEISLNLAIVLLVVAFVVLYVILRTAALAVSLPQRAREFRLRTQLQKANDAFHDAVRLLFEGRFGQAQKQAAGAVEAASAASTVSAASPASSAAASLAALSVLLAARAAQRLREPLRVQEWLARLDQADLHGTPDTHLMAARLMFEAEMHLSAQRPAEAIAVLHRLQQIAGRHLAALRLELRAQQALAHWDESLRLVRLLEKREAMSAEAAAEIRLHAHRENIALRAGDAAQLLAYRRQLPRSEMNPRVARVFAEALAAVGEADEATFILESQLDAEWPAEGRLPAIDADAGAALLRLYGEISGGDLTARIARAEAWLVSHPGDVRLLLTLGQLCLAQKLWGKAQSYLEATLLRADFLTLGDQRCARLSLARLFEATQRTAEAMPHYRAAAQLVG